MQAVEILKDAVLTLINYAKGNDYRIDKLDEAEKKVKGIVVSEIGVSVPRKNTSTKK